MNVRNKRRTEWLLLTFTLPTKRASQRVEIWRKLQRYGTVPLGNSGYLLPSDASNEERFQWLAATIRKFRIVRTEGDRDVARLIEHYSLDAILAALACERASILLFDDWFHYRGNPRKGESRAFTEFLDAHPEWQAAHYRSYGTFCNAFILTRK